jgi:hypothetical protein
VGTSEHAVEVSVGTRPRAGALQGSMITKETYRILRIDILVVAIHDETPKN